MRKILLTVIGTITVLSGLVFLMEYITSCPKREPVYGPDDIFGEW